MEELRKLVKELEKLSDEKEIIAKLQVIGEKLITDYEIKIGGTIIQPILVEAYYNDNVEDKTQDSAYAPRFNDTSVHAAGTKTSNTAKLARRRQKNHFGELYVHYGTKDGLDVVLSDNDSYYLSYLIKCSLIGEEFVSQCKASEEVCGQCGTMKIDCKKGDNCKYCGEGEKKGEIILRKKENSEKTAVVFTLRKGTKKGKFAKAPLAALAVNFFNDKNANKVIQGSLEPEHKKQWVLAKYALDNGKDNMNIDEVQSYIKELYSSKIEKKYFDSAKEYRDDWK